MKKKVIIIIAVVCVAIIAVVGKIFGVNAYNNYTIQQQTEQQIKSIDDTYSKFTKETDRAVSYTHLDVYKRQTFLLPDCSIRKSADQSLLTAPRSLSQLVTSLSLIHI